MARELIIDRIAEGLFQHTLIVDGEEQQAVIDNSPNLTSFENPDGTNPMDFKTKNGAPLVRAQKIQPEEITIADSFGGGGNQTGFTSDIQVFETLIALGYFERFVTSGGTPSNGTFKNLTDVFPNTFAGLDNMVFFVNQAMNRLEPRLVYNKRYLYELEDTAIPQDYSQLLGKVGGWSMVMGENNVPQYKFMPIDLPQNGVITPNGFTAIGSFSLEDMVFKAIPVFEWDYYNVHYIQTEEFETTINSAGTGNSRVDLIATVPGQNTFQKIEGDVYAGQNTGVKPPLPPGTLELTTLTIYEDTAQEPNLPITGDLYVTKKSLQDNSENASGSNAIIYLDVDEGKTGYNLNNPDLVSLGSIKFPAGTITIQPVLGSYFPITNTTGNDITIKHGIANDIPFINPEGVDVTLKDGSIALYRYDGTNMRFISIGTIGNSQNLEDVTTRGKSTTKGIDINGANLIVTSGNARADAIIANNLFKLGDSGGFEITSVSSNMAVNKKVEYLSSVPTTFSGRQLPDWNAVTAVTDLKANDSNILHKTGSLNESVNGQKTFVDLTTFYGIQFIPDADMRFGNDFSWKYDSALLGMNLVKYGFADGLIFVKNSNGFVGIKNTNPSEQLDVNGNIKTNGLIFLGQFTTGTEPTYIKGAQYFNTSINKIKFGGTTGWETVNPDNATRNLDVVVSASAASYQNNALIGASSISMIVMNGDISQPPFVFNSTTGTITMAVTIADILTIFYKKQ